VPALVKVLALALRLHAAVPALSWGETFEHVVAAERASTARVSAELLLAIAYIESRFDPTATSRVESGTRKTGHYPGTSPPRNLVPHTSLYCGPLQTLAGSWSECVGLRELPVAYAAGASEMETWLSDRRVHGDLNVALAGHGCGNYGVVTGRCNSYPSRVLSVRRLFTPPMPARVEARIAPRS
jgi:hypothetical protein